jgi:chorismate dehydratase
LSAGALPAGGRVRVGGIDYLNALPLTHYLATAASDGGPAILLSNHPPSALADKLRGGELDAALVPVVEYLARPSYRIFPGPCISSYGEVRSIRLYHRKPLREARLVGIDSSSRTSALLTRLLFEELWLGKPEYVELSPEASLALIEAGDRPAAAGGEAPDAALLIGDAALSARPGAGWDCSDLGTEWTRLTGLPFVYAFWVWRGGPSLPGLTDLFLRAKDTGTARIDDIVNAVSLPGKMDAPLARDYLRRVIQYDLGPLQLEGLALFFEKLHSARLAPEPRAPLPVEEEPSGAAPPGS